MLGNVGRLAYETDAPVLPVRVFSFRQKIRYKIVVKCGVPVQFAGVGAGLPQRDKYLAVGSMLGQLLSEIKYSGTHSLP